MPRNKFLPGQKRPPNSGRKKGSPNKRTLELIEVFEELKYDPARALFKLLPVLEEDKQADIHLKLMEYVYPKRKALEGVPQTLVQIKNETNVNTEAEMREVQECKEILVGYFGERKEPA